MLGTKYENLTIRLCILWLLFFIAIYSHPILFKFPKQVLPAFVFKSKLIQTLLKLGTVRVSYYYVFLIRNQQFINFYHHAENIWEWRQEINSYLPDVWNFELPVILELRKREIIITELMTDLYRLQLTKNISNFHGVF